MKTEIILKIYNTLVLPAFLYGSENWTLTASQRRRIEAAELKVIETSGRLHPLWPQNKWLHTPRTTDYRHARQDRWIQMELVSTLAKNGTKPNPFEIILLQTTRKENNWKTEETLERADVTLETERIKGSNPWCLWWWWILQSGSKHPKTTTNALASLWHPQNHVRHTPTHHLFCLCRKITVNNKMTPPHPYSRSINQSPGRVMIPTQHIYKRPCQGYPTFLTAHFVPLVTHLGMPSSALYSPRAHNYVVC